MSYVHHAFYYATIELPVQLLMKIKEIVYLGFKLYSVYLEIYFSPKVNLTGSIYGDILVAKSISP